MISTVDQMALKLPEGLSERLLRPSVAVITNIVPTYRFPVYESLNRKKRFRLQVFVTLPLSASCREAAASLSLKHSFSLSVARTTHHASSGATQREPLSIPIALAWDLWKWRPDVVISSDLGLRSLICWCLAKLTGARFTLSSEEIATSAVGRSHLQHRLRRFLLKRADACLAWGDAAKDYLRSIDVRDERIFTCAQAIDNEFWLRQADGLDRESERTALGVSGTVFLLVGRALRRKGFQNFLNAWSTLPTESHSKVSAIIVGDGDFLCQLKKQAANSGLRNVRFVGAQPADQLARYYSAADIFVLPSLEDVWGLVVNEALCFGLPILGSRFAGAAQSLIAGSKVGTIFNPADTDEFAMRLRQWADGPPPRQIAACRQILERETFSRSVHAFESMIAQITLPRGANGD
jgi:glycosyltransferase involved in cell wall biosynthesis